MVSAHLNFVLDLDGLQLFDPIVQEALQRCVFDAAPFSVSVGTSGLVLSGTVSAQNGIACGRVQTQTVPIGTLTVGEGEKKFFSLCFLFIFFFIRTPALAA